MNRFIKIAAGTTIVAILVVTLSGTPTQNSAEAPAQTVPATTTTTTLPPTTTTLSDVAEANLLINDRYLWRGQEAYENGEITAREYVNGLPFSYRSALPVLEAYEVVARDLGWDTQKIHDWRRFVHAIIKKESSYCWNLRRGVVFKNKGRGCAIGKQGEQSDAGFGQLTRTYWYAPGTNLCDVHGLCKADDIISEPYLSMASVLWTIDFAGRSPWCYTKAQEESTYFGCRFAPGNKHYDPTDDQINFIKDGRDVA